MIDELSEAINEYQQKWQALIDSANNKTYFKDLKPSSAAWKCEDLEDFNNRFMELRDLCDQIHMGWINDRWLATLHLKENALPWNIRIIKLMQRRPGSKDAVGLDHLDFYVSPNPTAKSVAEKETFKWSEEKNGEHCRWLSIWFDGTEAKLRSDTVLEVAKQELGDLEADLLKSLK